MQRAILTFLIIVTFNFLNAQINQYGVPFITNYSPQEYGASEQNWAIVQDNRGVIYVGNNDRGILEFDGVNWRQIPISNKSIIRSLALGSDGEIYVGGVNEFGKLEPDATGNLSFKSLTDLFANKKLNFGDVWKTYSIADSIYFCSYDYIFKIDVAQVDADIISLNPDSSKFTFAVNNQLYNYFFGKGLSKISSGKFEKPMGGNLLSNKEVFYMSRVDNNQLIVATIANGLFLFDEATNSFKSEIIAPEVNKTISSGYLYNGCSINPDVHALATLSNGLIILNRYSIENVISKFNGLQDYTICVSYNNNPSAPIWLGLNKGISKIEYQLPFRKFDEWTGIPSQVYDIIEFDGVIYAATSDGIYYMTVDANNFSVFKKVENLNDQVWKLKVIDQSKTNTHQLFAGTNSGIFEISKQHKAQLITDRYYTYCICKSEQYRDKLFIGHINGISIMNYSQNHSEFSDISGFKADVQSIEVDNTNKLWLSTSIEGVASITLSQTDTIIKKYGIESGLPSLKGTQVIKIDDTVYFCTEKGIFTFNGRSQLFEPSARFKSLQIHEPFGILRLFKDNNQNFWISANNKNRNWIEKGFFNNSGQYVRDTLSFKRLPNEQFDAVYNDSKGITWFGSSSGLYSFNPDIKVDINIPFYALVRKVTSVSDSVLFRGTNFTIDSSNRHKVALEQPTQLIPELDYEFNDLTFEYAAPYFIEEKKTEYSYLLDGYKDTWSKWGTEPKAVFTNLREGQYTFKVKARNIYGIESSVADYRFDILPPWYRTVWAYIFYSILGILFIILIVKLYTRKLRLEKVRLEGIVLERTAEIRCQKEAIEQKNEILKEQKEEIETQAERLKDANEVLTEQKEEILKQKEEITSSIKYAKRIQQAIVPSAEKATELLRDYFLLWRPRDIVSGDFWWLGEKGGYVVVAAADCTGHGVPGAFMSMLGVSFLNEIVNQQENTQSHEILNKLRTKVKSTLDQTGKEGEAKDGMDIALCVIDFNNMSLQFSGAYNPLYLFRDGQVEIIKADRNPIGIYIKEKESFTQNIVPLQKGDTLYIFSDGIVDQFGGEDRMKFTSNRFKELLESVQQLPMAGQREKINEAIDNWRGPIEQIDDIIVLGIKI